MELAIDTSTDQASVALALEGRLLSEVTWHASPAGGQGSRRHSATLLPQIDHLLQLQGAVIRDLGAVAVALGPGSFNGLRTGLGTAKGLCLALDIPLIGVGTLEVAAYPFAVTGRPICPVQEAGRGELAVALYQGTGEEGWRCLVPPQFVRAADLPVWARSDALFCGEIGTELAHTLRQTCGPDRVLTGAAAVRRAGVLAELAWRRLARGEVEDLDRVEPLYLRRPAISQPRVPIRRQEA